MVDYQTKLASEELQYPSAIAGKICNIINDIKFQQTKKLSNLLQYPVCGLSNLSRSDPIQLIYMIFTVAKSCETKSKQIYKKEKIFGKNYIKEVMKFIPIELFPVHKGMVANLDEFLKLINFIR